MEWQEWLEKDSLDGKQSAGGLPKGSKYSGLTPKQRKIQESMNNEKDSDNQYYKNASWESWLEKNNAIETSHKEGEKKEEWDGKFSSSTIRDDVKDDDKAVSEEESLEELTDGKLEEVEKLKAWEVFMVNKMPMNQYDKQPQKKRTIKGDGVTLDTNVGTVKEPLTETVPVSNPRGSIGNKKVKRIDHEAGDGSRKIVEIPKENNTNPEVKFMSGGRPESGEQGSINATAGGKGKVTLENSIQMLNSVLGDENKPTDKNESLPAVSSVPETPEAKRRRLIQGTYRKERNTDGSIKQSNSTVTNWESWLEKGSRWDTGKKENKFIDSLQAVGTMANEENNRSMKVIDDEIEHGIKPSNITSEPIKMPKKKVPSKDVDNRLNVLEAHKLKSWEGWLEKMQGAGDARYGNQHLTGLDQKPVNNEEDEANILPEKEEKTDNKEEKQEKTDNKPYKALGGE